MREKQKQQLSITLDKELVEKIDEMAEKMHKSRSDTINMLVKVAVKISGGGKLTEATKPIRKFNSFKEYLDANPQMKAIFNAMPPNQQQKWQENWEKQFLGATEEVIKSSAEHHRRHMQLKERR